jgi:N-sulfoglucosamine sulfohydrolase
MDARPNILWLSLEDCSPRLGCYGDPVARTPHLDALAAAGRRYEQAYSTAPVCAPARCAIITGCYAASIGAQHMRTINENPSAPRAVGRYECVPPPHVKLFPEYLRAAGWFCTNNEKTDYQFTPPFTGWDEQGTHAHWRHRAPGQPFFAVFNFTRTHESGMWPENRPEVTTDPDTVTLPPYLPDTPAARLALARHYDNLAEVDARVGEMLAQLEEDGLAENTVVMIWSDHGEGLPRRKRWPYASGLRVPLIVRWPGRIEPGEVSQEVVSTLDLGPTVLSLAGLPVPRHLQGRVFLGEGAGETPPRRYAFGTRDRYDEFYDCMRTVCDARYTYVRNLCPELPRAQWNDYLNRHPAQQELWRLHRAGQLAPAAESFFFASSRPPEELYDRENDPHELRNLSDDPAHRAKLRELRAALDAWQEEIGDLYREPEEQLARRFWPDSRPPQTQAPHWVAYDAEHTGEDCVPAAPAAEIELRAPAALQLYAPTHGASTGWRRAEDPESRWRLYTGPIPLTPGEHRFAAKCARLGYAESPVRELVVRVR